MDIVSYKEWWRFDKSAKSHSYRNVSPLSYSNKLLSKSFCCLMRLSKFANPNRNREEPFREGRKTINIRGGSLFNFVENAKGILQKME